MWRSIAPRLLAVLIVAIPLGCGDIKAPPTPSQTRVPTIVGEATAWAEPNISVRLDTGDIVAIDNITDLPKRPAQLTGAPVSFRSDAQPGSLILAGADEHGSFYAATRPGTADGCFELDGQGYTDPDQIHLSSGLVVPYAPSMTVDNGRFDQSASWLMESDVVCLDRAGRVTSILKYPFGA